MLLVFSNRGEMDYKSLASYLHLLEESAEHFRYNGAPNIFKRDQVEVYTPGKRAGLQIADAVASSFFFAVEESHFGLTEDSYVRALFPRMYRHDDIVWEYGIKMFPKECEAERQKGNCLVIY